MSLRDQLLAKGLATKKDARRVQRELKKRRLQGKGSQKRKGQLRREREAAEKLAAEKLAAARLNARKEREEKRDRYEAALRIRNLLIGHRVKNRGDHVFFFKAEDGKTIREMRLQWKVAEAVAEGKLAIAWLDQGNRIDYLLINASGAEKLVEMGAEHVLLHWFRGPIEVHERLLQRDWQTSLRPHRQR